MSSGKSIVRPAVLLWIILGLAVLVTIVTNVLHQRLTYGDTVRNITSLYLENFVKPSSQKTEKTLSLRGPPLDDKDDDDKQSKSGNAVMKREEAVSSKEDSEGGTQHKLADLSCPKHPSLTPKDISEMVYWSDIPSDSKYSSPFRDHSKYISFEPDHGGWNNIRMAMETVLVMAHAMGRTLVLPPEQSMYRLRDKGKKDQKIDFGFGDFFHLDSLDVEHEGIEIITMEEFLKREALNGKLLDPKTNEAVMPPKNRVDWDGSKNVDDLWDYLRNVGHVRPDWNPSTCIVAFPESADPKHIAELKEMHKEITSERPMTMPLDYTGKPVPVDAPAIERLKENIAARKDLCVYDEEMQNAPLVHFMVSHSQDARLLTHFYSFVFFQDWKQDLWTKRFVRDHMRYLDHIMCTAAALVKAVRERARASTHVKKAKDNKEGLFDSLHIRRGDFQYKKTRVEPPKILEITTQHIEEGATVFISTDEHNKSFFDPLKEHYDILFLDDFGAELGDINTNYYGMLDQLVASKGDAFVGTWWSTFTGYINRMRGYYIAKHALDGHEDGTMKSWYIVPEERVDEMREYRAVRLPIYMREFPTAWRDIDKGIDQLAAIE